MVSPELPDEVPVVQMALRSLILGGLIISILVVLLSVSMPILYAGGCFLLGDNINMFLSNLCHKKPTKSIFLLGYPFGVCARCFAIYFSYGAATLFFGFYRNLPNLLISLPMVIIMFFQVVLQSIIPAIDHNSVRFVAGVSFGIGFSASVFKAEEYIRNNNKLKEVRL
jgi:uncharacterized membrane protein